MFKKFLTIILISALCSNSIMGMHLRKDRHHDARVRIPPNTPVRIPPNTPVRILPNTRVRVHLPDLSVQEGQHITIQQVSTTQVSETQHTATTTNTAETPVIVVVTCNVCLDDKEVSAFGTIEIGTHECGTIEHRTLTCGHNTCNECLMHMVDTAIREKSTLSLRCPHCARQIQEDEVRNIVVNTSVGHTSVGDDRGKWISIRLEAYADIATAEYLAKQDNIKQCPTPDCPFKFFNENENPQRMMCPHCHAQYCSKCLTNHPQRTPCTITSVEWIDTHTMRCPRCHVPIQKDGGCSHVKCRYCDHDFNWRSPVPRVPALPIPEMNEARELQARHWARVPGLPVPETLELENNFPFLTRAAYEAQRMIYGRGK